MELAQDEFTNLLQRTTTDGMVRLVERVLDLLNDWAQMLAEARQELHVLSTPPTMPAVPPPDVPLDYLYTPHMNEALWERALSYLREQIDAEGFRSEDRLDHLWGQPEWRRAMLRMLRSLPSGTRSGNAASQNRRATAIAQFIRETVRESVAPVSLERYQPGRADLIAEFAQQYSVEHMLWRYAADANDLQKQLRALNGNTRHAAHPEIHVAPEMRPEARETTKTFPTRRYIETTWNRAKPTANYDVSDRLAVYGITVDFVAAGGAQDSDLARVLRDEFKFALLPTQDPFSVTVVRTVHGLALDDLDCMQRYRAEMTYLLPQERALIKLVGDPEDSVYRVQ